MAGRTVVFQTRKTKQSLVFRDGKVRMFDAQRDAFVTELNDSRTVYIVDSLVPRTAAAFSILVTSPKREKWFEFSKSEGVQKVVLPVFKLPELLQLRDVVYERDDPLRTDAAVAERFRKWGGVPRHTLANIDRDSQKTLEDLALALSPEDLAAYLRGLVLDGAIEAKHRVVHLKCHGENQTTTDGVAALHFSSIDYYTFHRGEV